jgi:NAD-dependent dihydropyrimidine dehydrogenase PreA subunit
MALVRIDYDLCDNSQVCEAVCPLDVFVLEGGIVRVDQPQECTLCWKCVENCASGAIELDS